MDIRFQDYLLEYAQASADLQRKQVEANLWQEFGQLRAVFVMDMSGFSRLTQRYGIVHYLSMVRRMQLISQPIIEQNGGSVIKYEADNCYAAFHHPLAAVMAGQQLRFAIAEMNLVTTEEPELQVSIGIDYGNVLMIGGPDFFGDVVNLACKLGEDLAGPGEILITRRAFEHILPDSGLKGKALHFSISGIELNAVLIES
jgi:class 3 adenylate cyclase